MYDIYRQAAIESLAAEAELRAVQLQQAYYWQLERIGQERAEATRYGSTPALLERYQAAEQQALASYQQQLGELANAVEQQQGAIQSEYDAKERSYDQAMRTPWQPSQADPLAPSYTPEAEEPEPSGSFFSSLLSWFS